MYNKSILHIQQVVDFSASKSIFPTATNYSHLPHCIQLLKDE